MNSVPVSQCPLPARHHTQLHLPQGLVNKAKEGWAGRQGQGFLRAGRTDPSYLLLALHCLPSSEPWLPDLAVLVSPSENWGAPCPPPPSVLLRSWSSPSSRRGTHTGNAVK